MPINFRTITHKYVRGIDREVVRGPAPMYQQYVDQEYVDQ